MCCCPRRKGRHSPLQQKGFLVMCSESLKQRFLFLWGTAFVPKPESLYRQIFFSGSGRKLCLNCGPSMITSQSWVIWLLMNSSPENSSSKAIRIFTAIVHKELEIKILKNKVSLPTPQSLPPIPVSERLLAFFITFSPNSFVHLFLGKDILPRTLL